MTRAFRPLFAFALSLLLLGVQLERPLHAISHVGEALGHSRDHSLVVPNEPCAECALLAAGTNALPGTVADGAIALVAQEQSQAIPTSATPAFSAYYQSRAPPALL